MGAVLLALVLIGFSADAVIHKNQNNKEKIMITQQPPTVEQNVVLPHNKASTEPSIEVQQAKPVTLPTT